METLSVGMYVKTLNGIVKIDKIQDNVMEDTKGNLHYGDFIKASYNIIDILEKGDYANGSEVLYFENRYIEEDDKFVPIGIVTENCYLENTDSWIIEKDIKSVITHEQIEQMAYKVGE